MKKKGRAERFIWEEGQVEIKDGKLNDKDIELLALFEAPKEGDKTSLT